MQKCNAEFRNTSGKIENFILTSITTVFTRVHFVEEEGNVKFPIFFFISS